MLNAAVKVENKKQQREQNDHVSKGAKNIGKKIDQHAAPVLRFVKRDEHCMDGGREGLLQQIQSRSMA